jgi:hypothetical protein
MIILKEKKPIFGESINIYKLNHIAALGIYLFYYDYVLNIRKFLDKMLLL